MNLNMGVENIEKFFLNTILKISIGGLFLILISNVVFFPEDILSISITAAILVACILAYFLRKQSPTASVLIVSIVSLLTMSYQRLTDPNSAITLSVIMIIGFVISNMLKGKLMWTMHGIAFLILNTIFVIPLPDAITAAITYSILYFVLGYATWVLKSNYDRIQQNLLNTNIQLNEKAKEIEAQNEELIQIQENLSVLNTDLEKIVDDRTNEIKAQNDILLKYSYRNAHHLRGPVARLLGLSLVYKLDPKSDPDFFMDKMVEQANEIDTVVKQINVELEASNGGVKNQK